MPQEFIACITGASVYLLLYFELKSRPQVLLLRTGMTAAALCQTLGVLRCVAARLSHSAVQSV